MEKMNKKVMAVLKGHPLTQHFTPKALGSLATDLTSVLGGGFAAGCKEIARMKGTAGCQEIARMKG